MTCFWVQQVYWESSRGDPSCLNLIKILIFWMIKKRQWSQRHFRTRNYWKLKRLQQMMRCKNVLRILKQMRRLLKVLMNFKNVLSILQQMMRLINILKTWKIWKRQWSQSVGRIQISLRVSLKDIQDGLFLIVSLKNKNLYTWTRLL